MKDLLIATAAIVLISASVFAGTNESGEVQRDCRKLSYHACQKLIDARGGLFEHKNDRHPLDERRLKTLCRKYGKVVYFPYSQGEVLCPARAT